MSQRVGDMLSVFVQCFGVLCHAMLCLVVWAGGGYGVCGGRDGTQRRRAAAAS